MILIPPTKEQLISDRRYTIRKMAFKICLAWARHGGEISVEAAIGYATKLYDHKIKDKE